MTAPNAGSVRLTFLSLFAGIGGIDLGLERTGMVCVGQVEIDSYCQRVLAKHWPEVPRHDDVRTAVEWWGGRLSPDVVAGGFPCQPVSRAGRRRAQADDRWLWPEFAGVIRALRPRYALVENVPGLLTRGLGDVLGDLAELGYDAEWDCLSAAFAGAPHIRGRIFLVAHANGEGRLQPEGRVSTLRGRAGDGSPETATLSDTASERREVRPPADSRPATAQLLPDPGRGRHRAPQGVLPAGRHGPLDGDWWAVEPDVGRVAYGVPAGVDRRRALGNAVVPQVAEYVGRLIVSHATEARSACRVTAPNRPYVRTTTEGA